MKVPVNRKKNILSHIVHFFRPTQQPIHQPSHVLAMLSHNLLKCSLVSSMKPRHYSVIISRPGHDIVLDPGKAVRLTEKNKKKARHKPGLGVSSNS